MGTWRFQTCQKATWLRRARKGTATEGPDGRGRSSFPQLNVLTVTLLHAAAGRAFPRAPRVPRAGSDLFFIPHRPHMPVGRPPCARRAGTVSPCAQGSVSCPGLPRRVNAMGSSASVRMAAGSGFGAETLARTPASCWVPGQWVAFSNARLKAKDSEHWGRSSVPLSVQSQQGGGPCSLGAADGLFV